MASKAKLEKLNKSELVDTVLQKQREVQSLNDKLKVKEDGEQMLLEQNSELQCKVVKITYSILERFDADGVDDINIPKKVNIWWALRNLSGVTKLIREIATTVKEPCLVKTTELEDRLSSKSKNLA